MLELNFVPFPEIKTERLLLRKMTDADAPEIQFLRSDDRVMKYIDREKTKTVEEALQFISSPGHPISEIEFPAHRYLSFF